MQRPSLLPTSTDPHKESESSWEEPLYTTAEGACGVGRVGHVVAKTVLLHLCT